MHGGFLSLKPWTTQGSEKCFLDLYTKAKESSTHTADVVAMAKALGGEGCLSFASYPSTVHSRSVFVFFISVVIIGPYAIVRFQTTHTRAVNGGKLTGGNE